MFPMKIICLLALVMSAVAIECPAGYEVVGSTCIHRLPGGYFKYDDAVNYCRRNFGRLPVLADCASFTEVATYVDDGGSTDAHNGYWLGATSPAPNHVWQWSDGTALQMGAPYWAANTRDIKREPHGGTGENCAHINPDRGWSIHDFACDRSNVYPVCSILPVHGYSPDGYWIGGSDCALEGQWRWTNGSPMVMGLPYWGITGEGTLEPDQPGVENCLELSTLWRYRFSNTQCTNTRRVICEARPL
ncbi:C-type lectin domain family 10 member A [Hyalella azteca]|uniref:C-type lectin domain family 10 member A n=1 Tax=Hyalella azteca TaxID=294128 RepID=A0A8B7P0J0_HYAAZ|nr:C-type lectin domain family 10 member A [Hyalella azteca]